MGLFLEQVRANYCGHEIDVAYNAFEGYKLYIDGHLEDQCKPLYVMSKTFAILRASIKGGHEKTHIVEVFSKGYFNTTMRISIDGQRVAGF